MSRMKYVLVLVAALLAPSLVLAQGESPKWGYIEAGYTDFNPDEGSSDDGWFAGGSMNLFKHFHLVAEYNDVGGYTFWNAGGGWHGLLGEKADLFAQVMWANIEVEDSDIDVDVAKGAVTLKGTVKTEAAKTRAAAIAKGTDGVTSVNDTIRVVK